MAKRVYKQKNPRQRIEDAFYVTSPYNDPAAVMASVPAGTLRSFGQPTVAGTGSIGFKQIQPILYRKQSQSTYPWYGYADVGAESYYRTPEKYRNRNVIPTVQPWEHTTQPYLTLGIEHTNKFNPRVDPYKRLTTKNTEVGAGLNVSAYDGGAGILAFAKPEIDYRIPFKKHSSSTQRERLDGPLGRYEYKRGPSIKSPVGLDIYGNLDAQYNVLPFNWTNNHSITRQLRDSGMTPNNFNMGRNRIGTNIGARAQWDNGFSTNLNLGAYYNPYNPSSKIVPVINAGVAYKYKDGGWLNQYGSGTSNVQPTLTFNTRPVGAVNVGTAADNTSVVVNTPRGPVVTGYRKDATPDPTITKKVQDAQAVSRPAAAEATTSEANLLNPIVTLGKGILDANNYLGRSIDESLPIALSRRYLDKTFNVPQKYRNRGGVSIYDNNETFKDAWEDARKKGQAIFWWKNPETGEYEKKSTKSELSEEDQLNKYGITDSQIEYFHEHPMTKEVGRRLRTNIYPFGYDVVNENGKRSVYGKVFNGLFLDKPVLNYDEVFSYGPKGMPSNEQVKQELERQENDPAFGPKTRNRMDAIRIYTGVPQKHNTFSISKYKFDPIEKAKGPQTYYSINMDNDTKQQMINAIYKFHGQENPFFRKDAHFEGASANPVYDSFTYLDGPGDYNKPYRDVDPNSVMGNYQLRRGKDDRGDYVSYYDYWDLDPIDLESKTGSVPPQPGKPFHIHDRIYVNNYGTAEKPDYKPMYFNDNELRNLENSIGDYSLSNFEEKKKPSNYNDIAQELLNRGYLNPDYNTDKVLFPDSDFAIYAAYMDWLNANSQKKKLGGWLNNYK